MAYASPPYLSVVIPTYREADNIPVLIREIATVMDAAKLRWEAIIVDDDSDDDTRQICEELAAQSLPLRLIVRTDERDLSTAVLCGFDAARGDILSAMDADLSHPPASLPALCEAVTAGADFAVCSRFVDGGEIKSDWPLWRHLVSRASALIARPVARVSDPMSGFFAIRKDCYRQAESLNPIGYKIMLELLVKCPVKQAVEVPILFRNRERGKSKAGLKQGIRFLRHLRRLYHHRYPTTSETVHFLAVGGGGMVVDILFYLFFTRVTGIYHVTAKALSFVAAAIFNWILNRRYSFVRAERYNPLHQLVRFLSVASIGALINITTYWQLTTHWEWFNSHKLAAILVAVLLTSVWNFLASKILVFKTVF